MVWQLQERAAPKCFVGEGYSGVLERQPQQHVCVPRCDRLIETKADRVKYTAR